MAKRRQYSGTKIGRYGSRSSKRRRRRRRDSALRRFFKRFFRMILVIIIAVVVIIAGSNIYMIRSTQDQIVTSPKASETIGTADAVLVLGAGILSDGSPSLMLKDRLNTAITLYENGVTSQIVITGNGTTDQANEITAMSGYLTESGIPASSVTEDTVGFSTYDSIKNICADYSGKTIIIVTQRYHLYRALYLADCMSLEAYGVPSKNVRYSGQLARDVREVFARTKDFFFGIVQRF